MDVAQALTNLLSIPSLPGTYSLPGPSEMTYEYILTLISGLTYQPPSRAPTLPKPFALAIARLGQAIWWPTLCPDEVRRRYIDDVAAPGDWDKFGIVPDEIEQHAIAFVRRYRSAYVSPPAPLSSSGPGNDLRFAVAAGRTSRAQWCSPLRASLR